jgi:hypothetical protein
MAASPTSVFMIRRIVVFLKTDLWQPHQLNGATFIVKVPIQGGIDLQPGGGAYLQLVPPIGDGDSRHGAAGQGSAFSGMYMITDIAQSFSLDDRQFQATTIFSCTRNVRSALD